MQFRLRKWRNSLSNLGMSDLSECRVGTTLGALARGYRGVSYAPNELRFVADGDTATLLRANNIQNGQLDLRDVQYVPRSIVAKNQMLEMGDIAVCMSNGSKALVGKSAQFRGGLPAVTVGAFCSVFKPVDNDAAALLPQLFRSESYVRAVDTALAGSAINNLKTSDIERVCFHLPSRTAWPRIAAILTSLDTTIEATEALIEKHQRIRAGLTHDLFAYGVLPSGKCRPAVQGAPSARSAGGTESICQAWDLVPASRVCSLITKGTTPPAEEMWQGGEGVRFLRVDNLTFAGELDFGASDFRISFRTHATTLARSRCQRDDVLMNIVGPPLGKVGLVTDEDVNINQAIAVFRPNPTINARYLRLWLTSEFAKRWILQRAKQTSGQVNVTLAMCQALPVPLAPIDEQLRIVERVQASEELLKSLSLQAEKLRMQKQGLMQDLLTGKVRVRAD